jgi:hypothetical protein
MSMRASRLGAARRGQQQRSDMERIADGFLDGIERSPEIAQLEALGRP